MDSVDGNCFGKTKKNSESASVCSVDEEYNNVLVDTDQNSNAVSKQEVTAIMPVSKNSRYYNMSHHKRGLLYVFNHDKYEGSQKPRSGASEDCKKIKDCFYKLDFEIVILNNLRLTDIKKHISKVSQMDHRDHDCVAMFVLTHGDKDLLWAYDQWYEPDEVLWGPFTGDKCPSLAGKPKLFFVQACLGNRFDEGIKLVDPNSVRRTQTDGAMLSYKIPVRADFLIAFSTVPGYFSFRNTEWGSYFVTALCEELEEHAYKQDIHTILTFVNQRVAIEFESNANEEKYNNKKQAPHFQSSLTRLLYFEKKTDHFVY